MQLTLESESDSYNFFFLFHICCSDPQHQTDFNVIKRWIYQIYLFYVIFLIVMASLALQVISWWQLHSLPTCLIDFFLLCFMENLPIWLDSPLKLDPLVLFSHLWKQNKDSIYKPHRSNHVIMELWHFEQTQTYLVQNGFARSRITEVNEGIGLNFHPQDLPHDFLHCD